MSTFNELWKKLGESREYREEFVTAQVKRGIPFQISTLLKDLGISQAELAQRSGLTQGVISRAANPNYGNLTLNTLIRIAAGFDVAFVGKFVPFTELGKWYVNLSEDSVRVKPFTVEHEEIPQPNDKVGLAMATLSYTGAPILTESENAPSYQATSGNNAVGGALAGLAQPSGNNNYGTPMRVPPHSEVSTTSRRAACR